MYNFKYSYEEFRPWTDSCEGMEIIPKDADFVRVTSPMEVKYAEKDGIDLHIRFLVPEREKGYEKYPLIMHVQGSGWALQNMTSHIGDFAPAVKAGYKVAVIQYRNADIAGFPAQIIDLKDAAAFLLEHAEEYQIDTDNIFLAGDSSGGHTAVLGFLTWGLGVLDTKRELPLPKLKGLLDFYGVTSIRDIAETETGVSKEDNHRLLSYLFDHPEEEAELADAVKYIGLREELEPVIIFHGNKDRLVPLSHSIKLYEELKKRNTEVRLIMIDGADHGGSMFWNDRQAEIMTDWLKEHTARD